VIVAEMKGLPVWVLMNCFVLTVQRVRDVLPTRTTTC